MTILSDKNISAKDSDKLANLEIESVRMWHLSTTTISIIVGAFGTIQKNTDIHIKKIPRKPTLPDCVHNHHSNTKKKKVK